MYIEFNITLNGKHFFATDKRSCTDSTKAIELKKVLFKKFPKSEGYKITASFNPQRYYGMDLNVRMDKEVDRILTSL